MRAKITGSPNKELTICVFVIDVTGIGQRISKARIISSRVSRNDSVKVEIAACHRHFALIHGDRRYCGEHVNLAGHAPIR